jgi:hypothetical protein
VGDPTVETTRRHAPIGACEACAVAWRLIQDSEHIRVGVHIRRHCGTPLVHRESATRYCNSTSPSLCGSTKDHVSVTAHGTRALMPTHPQQALACDHQVTTGYRGANGSTGEKLSVELHPSSMGATDDPRLRSSSASRLDTRI